MAMLQTCYGRSVRMMQGLLFGMVGGGNHRSKGLKHASNSEGVSCRQDVLRVEQACELVQLTCRTFFCKPETQPANCLLSREPVASASCSATAAASPAMHAGYTFVHRH